MQHNYKLTSITFADENENQVDNFIIKTNYYFLKYIYVYTYERKCLKVNERITKTGIILLIILL